MVLGKGDRVVKGFGRGRSPLVLHGLWVDGGMEHVNSQLDQGTEPGFLCPEPREAHQEQFWKKDLPLGAEVC